MIHQPLGGVSGQASDIEIEAAEIKRIKDQLNSILSKNTGKKIEQVAKDTDRNFWMDANTAKKYGLIDTVLK